jgi:hypothetical protein
MVPDLQTKGRGRTTKSYACLEQSSNLFHRQQDSS